MLRQYYQTSVVVSPGNDILTCVSLPARSISEAYLHGLSKIYMKGRSDDVKLFLDNFFDISGNIVRISPAILPLCLRIMIDFDRKTLSRADTREIMYLIGQLSDFPNNPIAWSEASGYLPFVRRKDDLYSSLERASFQQLVPIEQSPLQLASLAGLAADVAGGAYIAQAAGVSGPMLLFAVPVGIILVGAARGIAQGLQEGLHEKILKLMGATDDASPEDPARKGRRPRKGRRR